MKVRPLMFNQKSLYLLKTDFSTTKKFKLTIIKSANRFSMMSMYKNFFQEVILIKCLMYFVFKL